MPLKQQMKHLKLAKMVAYKFVDTDLADAKNQLADAKAWLAQVTKAYVALYDAESQHGLFFTCIAEKSYQHTDHDQDPMLKESTKANENQMV